MTHTITLIPGDGIGPEVTAAVVSVIEAAGVSITWERHDAGVVALERHRSPLPDELIESIQRNKVALKGPVTTPVGEGFTSVNVGLRKALDLFATFARVERCRTCDSRSRASISSSCAKTPKTCTPASSTKSFLVSSKA